MGVFLGNSVADRCNMKAVLHSSQKHLSSLINESGLLPNHRASMVAACIVIM